MSEDFTIDDGEALDERTLRSRAEIFVLDGLAPIRHSSERRIARSYLAEVVQNRQLHCRLIDQTSHTVRCSVDGQDLSEMMLACGMGHASAAELADPNSFSARAMRDAKARKLGIWGLDSDQREIPYRWRLLQAFGPIVALVGVLVSLFIFGLSRWLATHERHQDAIPVAKSLLGSTRKLEQQISATAAEFNKLTGSSSDKDFSANLLAFSTGDLQFPIPAGADKLDQDVRVSAEQLATKVSECELTRDRIGRATSSAEFQQPEWSALKQNFTDECLSNNSGSLHEQNDYLRSQLNDFLK